MTIGGKVRQMFVEPTILEDCLETVDRRCDWNMAVKVSAVIILFDAVGRIYGSV